MVEAKLRSSGGEVIEELDLNAAAGFVEPGLAAEFPGLRLDWVSVVARDRPSPPAIVGRLHALSNRYRGNSVVAMRTHPIPRAYRSFFRQIGLDPDSSIPSEQAALSRLMQGGFRSASPIIPKRSLTIQVPASDSSVGAIRLVGASSPAPGILSLDPPRDVPGSIRV